MTSLPLSVFGIFSLRGIIHCMRRFPKASGTAELTYRGSLLEVKVSRSWMGKQIASKRARVGSVWSRQSRARLAKRVFELFPAFRKGYNYAVTLTYRQRTPSESKRDLRCLRMRLARYLQVQEWFALWKMEFQKRGVVHYHIILNINQEVSLQELRRWISDVWAEITSDPQLAITGTRVDKVAIERIEQVLVYVIGHAMTKKKDYQNRSNGIAWTGRWWGTWNKPKEPEVKIQLTFQQSQQLKRQFAKIRPIRKKSARSYWVYCEKDLLEGILNLFEIPTNALTKDSES